MNNEAIGIAPLFLVEWLLQIQVRRISGDWELCELWGRLSVSLAEWAMITLKRKPWSC